MRVLTALLVVALVGACGGGGKSGTGGDGGAGDGDADTDADADVDGDTDAGTGGGDGGPGGGPLTGARVFDLDVLHEVEITVAPEYLDTLENDTSVRVPCTIRVDDETVTQAAIRKKGQTSMRSLDDKPGFTIKMNELVPGQRLDGLKKLVLDNEIEDPSLLTGHLAYEVYRRAGLPAPRTSHGVVIFNGTIKGLYVIEEPTNPQFLAAHYGSGDGNLYEGPWDFPQSAGAADLKDEVTEARTRDDLEALTDIVMHAPDDALAASLAPLLDVDQFITNYAIEVVGALWDGYAYAAWNYYLYDVPADGRFVILPHGVNWPYWHADLDPFDLYTYPWGDGTPPGHLCERLRDVPALDEQFHTAVRDVTRTAWDVPALLARIDRAEATLRSRPLDGAAADDLGDFDGAVGDARDFVVDRRAYLGQLLGIP